MSLRKKSRHDIERICQKYGVSESNSATLSKIAGIYCTLDRAIEELTPLCTAPEAKSALDELCGIWELIKDTTYAERVRVDFSIISDMNYYNGIVFSGFIDGIFTKVLSGGRYDRLMHRMGKRAGAVGFALYLDLLEGIEAEEVEYDVDTLILTSDKASTKEISETVARLTKLGQSVSVQKTIPEKLRYREIIKIGCEEGEK